MVDRSCRLSPDDPDSSGERIRQIAEFWNQLDVCDDPGKTTWGVLDGLKREVTDCLYRKPPDLNKAESLTAYAMLLMAGSESL